MSRFLKILVVDDSPNDAEIEIRNIEKAGYKVEYKRVDSEDGLLQALNDEKWDIVLGDYTMPGFSGTKALHLIRAFEPELPFIFVSGTIGEDTAVESMRAGAKDYVVKDNLRRLVPAIERELVDVEEREQRRRADAERRTAEARYEHLVTTAPNAIIAMDHDHRITVFNQQAEEIFGYSASEVLGKDIGILIPERFQKAHRNHVNTFLASPATHKPLNIRSNISGRRKSGEEFPAQASISKIMEENKPVFMVTIDDITERVQTEAQLRQAQRMESVGQLVGGLAHDFNNLLTVIMGNLDLLGAELKNDTEAKELAGDAFNACLRGAELTRNLLAFARSQTLVTNEFDLNKLVLNTTSLLRRTLEEQIEITTRLADDLWYAFADPSQAESALTNLAINARDAMPQGGDLIIETCNVTIDERSRIKCPPGDYVKLSVSDTGMGMDETTLQKVFEPFFTTKGHHGTGLGLSMIYGYAKQSKGHIEIDSAPGQGTTVSLYLPVAGRKTVSSAGVEEGSDAPAVLQSKMSVLLVDDNAAVRSISSKHLVSLGHKVYEARDGRAALRILEQRSLHIDLVITDLIMPGGMSGYDLARKARELNPELKFLFSSGYVNFDQFDKDELDALGGFLGKPYSRLQLIEKIGEAMKAQ